MRRFILSLIIGCAGVSASAAAVSERVYISTDKDVYVAGDLIWCSAFCIDPSTKQLSSASSVAYVEVSSTDGTVATGKIALIDGRGSGVIPIPASAPTGNYRLLGYTSAEKGRSDLQEDSKLISIFSTLGTARVSGGVEVVDGNEYSSPGEKASAGDISISVGPYAARSSSIPVKLENRMGSAATLSLSVHVEDGIASPSASSLVDFMDVHSAFKGEPVDIDGEVFHGRLVGNGIQDIVSDPNIVAAIAFPGMAKDVYVGRFKPDGTFAIPTVNVYGNRDLVCEILGHKGGSDCRMVIDSPFLHVGAGDVPLLKISPVTEQALLRRSLAMQADRKAGTDTLYDFMPKRESTLLSDTYCVAYHLDDYVRFPTIRETILEITSGLRIRKGSDGKPQLQVLLQGVSDDRLVYSSDVLAMIDGVPVQDVQALLDFDCMLLGDILIYPYSYLFGDVVYKGLVDFVTKKGDISSFKFDKGVVIVDWQGESYPVAYTCSRLPEGGQDLRGTLYWHPQVDLETSGGSTSIEVRTPSYPGVFKVVVEGLASDGRPVRCETSFEVR